MGKNKPKQENCSSCLAPFANGTSMCWPCYFKEEQDWKSSEAGQAIQREQFLEGKAKHSYTYEVDFLSSKMGLLNCMEIFDSKQTDSIVRIQLLKSGAPEKIFTIWNTDGGLNCSAAIPSNSIYESFKRVETLPGQRFPVIINPAQRTDYQMTIQETKVGCDSGEFIKWEKVLIALKKEVIGKEERVHPALGKSYRLELVDASGSYRVLWEVGMFGYGKRLKNNQCVIVDGLLTLLKKTGLKGVKALHARSLYQRLFCR